MDYYLDFIILYIYHEFMNSKRHALKVADEVWVATALLHREHPKRSDFTQQEIIERVRRMNAGGEIRPGVNPHVSVHCVANARPNPARCRMLFSTGASRRRLFRLGDRCDPGRDGKIVPRRADLPPEYHALLDWYSGWAPEDDADPLLNLAQRHRHVWRDLDADAYVRGLREGWK